MTDNPALPSWRDTPTRRTIEEFVAAVTDPAGPDHVPAEARIATFDNDGTLWTEKPMPVQLHYLLTHWRADAEADPSLASRQPYAAAVSGDDGWLATAIEKHYDGDDSDLGLLIAAVSGATAGISVDDYAAGVAAFYRDAVHPTLKTTYRYATYLPMVELLGYLTDHGFTTYIVSGGDRDFMRPMTQDFYAIPAERVVGTGMGLTWDAGSRTVKYTAKLAFFDDGPEKPVRIWMRTGRRPILTGGNSNGDLPMLQYAQGAPRGLSLLIHHDDDTGRGDIPYDAGAERALASAASDGVTVVSVKDDWATVFPTAPGA